MASGRGPRRRYGVAAVQGRAGNVFVTGRLDQPGLLELPLQLP
jgi:hypothetical protein